jgi:hypothetical protein
MCEASFALGLLTSEVCSERQVGNQSIRDGAVVLQDGQEAE